MKKLIFALAILLISFILCLNAYATLGEFTAYNCSGYQNGNTIYVTWTDYGNVVSYEITYTIISNASNRTITLNVQDNYYIIDDLNFGNKVAINVDAIYANGTRVEVFAGLELNVLYLPPTLVDKDTNSVELEYFDGFKYSMDGLNFHEEYIFKNLDANVEYKFYQMDKSGNISNPLSVILEGVPNETTNQPGTDISSSDETQDPQSTQEPEETTTVEPEIVDPRTLNTKTSVFGNGISIVNNSGNYNQTYFIYLSNLTSSISSNNKEYSNIVNHSKKVIGKQYGDILGIYRISFGYDDGDGDQVYVDLPYNSVLSIDVSSFNCNPIYICFDYEKEASKLTSSIKDGNLKCVINVDSEYKYIVLVGDKDALKNNGYVPQSNKSQSPSSTPSFSGLSSEAIPYIIIAVVAVAVGVVLMLIFIKKVRTNQSREWLKNNKR